MRVKVGDTWYDSSEHSLIVQFTKAEKEYVKTRMSEDRTYLFPIDFTMANMKKKWRKK